MGADTTICSACSIASLSSGWSPSRRRMYETDMFGWSQCANVPMPQHSYSVLYRCPDSILLHQEPQIEERIKEKCTINYVKDTIASQEAMYRNSKQNGTRKDLKACIDVRSMKL